MCECVAMNKLMPQCYENYVHTFLFSSVILSVLVGPSEMTLTDSTPLPGECFNLRISCSDGTRS